FFSYYISDFYCRLQILGLYLLLSASWGHIINCTKTNYPTVSCLFPSDTTVLDLSHNSIRRILWQNFSRVMGLKQLFLAFNEITFIATDAFENNPHLELLDISHNCLNAISSLPFMNLLALKHLDLSNNEYSEITLQDEFRNLQNLTFLKIGSPQISTLKANTFSELEGIPLKQFHLITGDISEYEGSLKMLKSLDTLILELNMWAHLDILKSLLGDISNATKALQIINVNLTKSGKNTSVDSFLIHSKITSIAFQNISTNVFQFARFLRVILSSDIEEVKADTLYTTGNFTPCIQPFKNLRLRRIFFKNLDNPYFLFFFPQPTIPKFASHITHLIVINCQFYFFPCLISDSLTKLEIFDFSVNKLSEKLLFPKCHKPFPQLRSLTINSNNFEHLAFLGNATSHMKNLVNFSASSNNIYLESRFAINWTQSLLRLNLSRNAICSDVFAYLPETLLVLDLSFNDISTITGIEKMKWLQEIHLSGNSLFSLAELSSLSSVQVLHANRNKISVLMSYLMETPVLMEVNLGRNPFLCDCEIQVASNYFQNTAATVIGWPLEYQCDLPGDLNGTLINSVAFPWTQCNPGYSVLLSSVPLLIIAFVLILYYRKWKQNRYTIYYNEHINTAISPTQNSLLETGSTKVQLGTIFSNMTARDNIHLCCFCEHNNTMTTSYHSLSEGLLGE
uniref:Toll-like receptor 2 n=1 Tax=Erpetoichthys calabaricus TaxID=27687 RepID=A0A8C4SKR4_ERPCA